MISDGGHNRENSPGNRQASLCSSPIFTVGFSGRQNLLISLFCRHSSRSVYQEDHQMESYQLKTILRGLNITFPLKIPPVSMFGKNRSWNGKRNQPNWI